MKIIFNKKKLISFINKERNLGFVPTMGAIHKGHISLIKKSIKQCDKTIVSIFINRPQFNKKSDYIKYPKSLKKDIFILKKLKIDYLYIPTTNQIYPDGVSKNIKEESLNGKGSLWIKIITWLSMGTEGNGNLDNKAKSETEKVKGSLSEGREIDWFGWTRQGVLYLCMAVSFWLISGQTAISFVPGPSIHTGVYATFLKVKKLVPEDAVLLTWWDYGYALTEVTGQATFHDGGAQTSPKTFFVARSFISDNPDELYNTISYLAGEGARGIYHFARPQENESQQQDDNYLQRPHPQNVHLHSTPESERGGHHVCPSPVLSWFTPNRKLTTRVNLWVFGLEYPRTKIASITILCID